MAAAPAKKDNKPKVIYATSGDCEVCKNKCLKGESYLKRFQQTKKGNGVVCKVVK